MAAMANVRTHAKPVIPAALASIGRCDHVDAVAVDLPAGTNAIDFTRSVLQATPEWVHSLLTLRDKVMQPFGLHAQERVTAESIRVEAGAKLGPFRLLEVSDTEVLAGDNDKHLDFRTSFAVRKSATGTGTEGVCTTVVRFHRRAGRMYFMAIQPFHNLIIPRLVGGAYRT
ncbi:DUF2867 domain-containing protein [Streptomyces sp. NPDC048416]|uniref:DUF2867 domain-containing protein n=1 Tax=Streptomyces sp. NPDC048416 TaxID=3365546 RepID=UPI003719EB7C